MYVCVCFVPFIGPSRVSSVKPFGGFIVITSVSVRHVFPSAFRVFALNVIAFPFSFTGAPSWIARCWWLGASPMYFHTFSIGASNTPSSCTRTISIPRVRGEGGGPR